MTKPAPGDDFFAAYQQRELKFGGFSGKSPLFFRDAAMMSAVFTADAAALREALPNALYAPFELSAKRGLVGIHCMEYKDSDIGPYNEVALTIVTAYGAKRVPFTIRLLNSALTRSYHSYVVDLPVTTEAALAGGVEIFNFPKYLADISFRETARHRICTVRDAESMDLILEFVGRKTPTNRPWSLTKRVPDSWRQMSLHAYPVLNGKVVDAHSLLRFKELDLSVGFSNAAIRLGTHPHAEPYKRLKIGRPLQYIYSPKYQAILFEPEEMHASFRESRRDWRRDSGTDGGLSSESSL